MKTSDVGKKLIKKYEGLRLTAYSDAVGIKTIGYGHTGKNLPNKITQTEAEIYFEADVLKAEKQVNKFPYPYTQNQYDALVSFAFNIGSIDQLTAKGTRTLDQIADKMLLYVHAGGKKLMGLVNRRNEEYALFIKDDLTNSIHSYVYKNTKEIYLSKNFKVKEFIAVNTPLRTMYDKGEYVDLLIDNKLVSLLQKIRDHYGKPVVITSGYRPEDYNKSIDGATSSMHINGQAADIKIKGVTPKNLAAYCKSIDIKGIGTYSTFVHIDTRENTYYWNG